MKDEIKTKLDSVLQRKLDNEAAAEAARLATEKAAQQRDAKTGLARERWRSSVKEIDAAVKAINSQIENAKMALSWEEKPRDKDHPSISQLFVKLSEPGNERERKLVLNVNAFGLVQPVALIPHTGKKVADFQIEDVDQAHYEAIIVEFLDQCVSKAKPR